MCFCYLLFYSLLLNFHIRKISIFQIFRSLFLDYFSYFGRSLAIYEIKDFVKIFGVTAQKKPHPKNERGKSENGQRNRSESGERLFLLFFVGFGLLGAGFGLRFLVTLRGRAAAATATIFVVLVHHCYLNFIITHSRNSTPKIAATQQSNGPADINPLHKICQDVWSKCRKSWHTLIYLGKFI